MNAEHDHRVLESLRLAQRFFPQWKQRKDGRWQMVKARLPKPDHSETEPNLL